MSFHDWADLVLYVGLFLLAFSAAFFFLPIGSGGMPVTWIVVDLLSRNRSGRQLMADLKDPQIALGGLLGLTLIGMVSGVVLLGIGALMWVAWFLVR